MEPGDARVESLGLLLRDEIRVLPRARGDGQRGEGGVEGRLGLERDERAGRRREELRVLVVGAAHDGARADDEVGAE